MDKEIGKEEIQKLVSIFKKIHFDSSLKSFHSRRKILATDAVKYDEVHNIAFMEFIGILKNTTQDYNEKELSEKSFIIYREKKTLINPIELNLTLKDYLNIARKSSNYFEYLSNLRDLKP